MRCIRVIRYGTKNYTRVINVSRMKAEMQTKYSEGTTDSFNGRDQVEETNMQSNDGLQKGSNIGSRLHPMWATDTVK